MKNLMILAVALLGASRLVAGDPQAPENKDRTGLTYGASFGMNLASNKSAMFYNGAPDKENSIERIMSSTYVQQAVYEQVNDDIVDTIYPENMNYKAAVSIAGFLGYVLKNNMTVFLQMEYMKVSTGSIFKLELSSPSDNDYSSANYYDGEIKAQESRVDISAGLHIPFTRRGMFNPFVEATAGINFVKVLKHEMTIGTYTTSLVYTTTTSQYTEQTQGGMGYGVSLGGGVEGPLSSKIFYNMGVSLSMKKINLLADAGLTPHESLYLRFLF